MHERLLRGGPGIALGGDVRQPGAQREYEIRLAECLPLVVGISQAQLADIEFVIIGKDILTPERHRNRKSPGFCEAQERLSSIRHVEFPTGEQEDRKNVVEGKKV